MNFHISDLKYSFDLIYSPDFLLDNFSVHCFNDYDGNGQCPDLEVSYYMECYELVKDGGQRKSYPTCRQRPLIQNITNSIPSNLKSCGNSSRKK